MNTIISFQYCSKAYIQAVGLQVHLKRYHEDQMQAEKDVKQQNSTKNNLNANNCKSISSEDVLRDALNESIRKSHVVCDNNTLGNKEFELRAGELKQSDVRLVSSNGLNLPTIASVANIRRVQKSINFTVGPPVDSNNVTFITNPLHSGNISAGSSRSIYSQKHADKAGVVYGDSTESFDIDILQNIVKYESESLQEGTNQQKENDKESTSNGRQLSYDVHHLRHNTKELLPSTSYLPHVTQGDIAIMSSAYKSKSAIDGESSLPQSLPASGEEHQLDDLVKNIRLSAQELVNNSDNQDIPANILNVNDVYNIIFLQ